MSAHLNLDAKLETEFHDDRGGDLDTNAVALAAQYEPGSEAEKKFLKKIDYRINRCHGKSLNRRGGGEFCSIIV